jgi:prepilin-type N-terminal cleavage/methylation domain-containing protein
MSPLPKIADEQGFTLLELLVVIVLIALISATGTIWIPGIRDRLIIARAENQVEQELTRVAYNARRTGQDLKVQLETEGDFVALRTFDRAVRLDGGIRVDWVAAVEAGAGADGASIVYFGTGGASGGRLDLSRGAARASIVVDWLTGASRRLAEAPQ